MNLRFQQNDPVECACGFVMRFRDLDNHRKGCKATTVSYAGEMAYGKLKQMEREQWRGKRRRGRK